MKMKVFTNTQFEGFWGVGSAAIVVAETSGEAAVILRKKLKERGLGKGVRKTNMEEIEMECGNVYILCDGDY